MYTLLIADDESELRVGLSNYFPWNEVGFQVIQTCSDGAEAFKFLLNNPVDAVITDVVMPGMGGLELAAFVKDKQLKTKVFVLSGYSDFTYAQRAMELGVKKYILKPAKYDELYKTFSLLKEELDQENSSNIRKLKKTPIEAEDKQNYYNVVVQNTKDFIAQNYSDLSLEKIAKNVYLSPNYLSHIFKMKTGKRISDYISDVRMEKAIDLLLNKSLQIIDVSLSIGYANPNNFTRAFKAKYGISPSEFRQKNEYQ